MASKNWKWVIDVWFEAHDPARLNKGFIEQHGALEHWVQWTSVSEYVFLELGGKLPDPEPNKSRRRLRNKKKSRRSRPSPPTFDWTMHRKVMTPRLIHACLPIIALAQSLTSQDMHRIASLMRPSHDHTCHWRLRNVNTGETIPGVLLVS